jgi:hypothetical protein
MYHIRSHQMQKHKFGILCSGMLFIDTTLGSLEHEK